MVVGQAVRPDQRGAARPVSGDELFRGTTGDLVAQLGQLGPGRGESDDVLRRDRHAAPPCVPGP